MVPLTSLLGTDALPRPPVPLPLEVPGGAHRDKSRSIPHFFVGQSPYLFPISVLGGQEGEPALEATHSVHTRAILEDMAEVPSSFPLPIPPSFFLTPGLWASGLPHHAAIPRPLCFA